MNSQYEKRKLFVWSNSEQIFMITILYFSNIMIIRVKLVYSVLIMQKQM